MVELLTVIGAIAILAAMLLPVFNTAKARSRRVVCESTYDRSISGCACIATIRATSPLRQGAATVSNFFTLYSGYKEKILSYVAERDGLTNALFACPGDSFFPNFITNSPPPLHYVRTSFHDVPFSGFSSYMFNGGDNVTRSFGTFK